jgi:CRP-like cAMP-binding protein
VISGPLVHKLDCCVRLSEADRICLADAISPARMVAARTDIIHEGDDPRAVNVILDGWACRYRQFANGRRQIVSLVPPGDPCDPHVFLLDEMDHTIGSITPVLLGQIAGPAAVARLARFSTVYLHLTTHAERASPVPV